MHITEARSGRILVVDDQPANLRVVATLLERHGLTAVAAGSGREALAAARADAPDLLLLDMRMPGMDGFELLAAFRADPALADIPAIFLTAAHDRDLLVRAFEAGAVDYVTKPFMAEELLARVDAQLGLKLTRDRLQRIARERQQLVNLVAHDLKNPLSTVLFAAQMLQQPDCRRDRVPRYLQIVQDSTEDALDYIRRYLEQQAAGRSEDAAARADLGATLVWLEQRYALPLEAAGMRLDVQAPAQPLAVAAEPLVLRQVAENLVTNALKYARGGGELTLSARPGAPGFARLLAEDRGPGIPAALQRQLFKPFQRLDPDAGDRLSSGLGLALAHQIVAERGGQLWYEDRPGGGARFVLELPAARAA
ncbi:hybrid sensor histidine kinase/response regulator [Thermomonas flagellata]|uniref:hybrid sensor histidine kinase/response regulator n=1 Tax=Thermomonas flagellata TaxID=2888524 RepID=UPI001F03B742|nr:hybrid sensor histidine kinase/response regulator [Thermomonas flagellata]